MESPQKLILLLLLITCFVCPVAAQLPSLSEEHTNTAAPAKQTDTIWAKSASEKTGDALLPKEKKYNYLTWFMECSYVMIPASISHGAELHFEFINRVKKTTAFKPSVGLGGSYFQHVYKQYDYGDYKADVLTIRYSGQFTLGARVVHRLGGICLRVGYNAMYIHSQWSNFTGINYQGGAPVANTLLHRIQFEAVGFKSFSKKKPGVGILGGVQYLLSPEISRGSDLLIIKAGIAF